MSEGTTWIYEHAHRDGLRCRIHSRHDPKRHQRYIRQLRAHRARACFVVEHAGVQIAQRYAIALRKEGIVVSMLSELIAVASSPSKASNKRDELVQVFRAHPADA